MNAQSMTGWSPTLAEFSAWLANARGQSDIERQIAQRVGDAYRDSLIAKIRRAYDDAAAHNEREQEAARRILNKLSELMDEAAERRRRGEIDDDELLAITTEVERDRQRTVAMSNSARQVEERAWEEAQLSPEEWQSRALSRFPALRSRLPLITDDVMQGRERPRF